MKHTYECVVRHSFFKTGLMLLSFLLSGIIFCSTADTTVAPPNNWEFETKPVWADEFNYNGKPDSTKWSYDLGNSGWGNHELENYTDKNATVANGVLSITALKDYTSSRIVTKGKGDFLYGRFEIRAKLPAGKGTWPAIWMLPTDWAYGGWPKSGEVDIMEHVGYDPNNIHITAHTGSYYFKINTKKTSTKIIPTAITAFHVYRLDWTPDFLRGFIDGKKVFEFANEGTGFMAWPFDKRFHVLLNLAIGGDWGGKEGVDDKMFPTTMQVDYVRVYKLKSDVGMWLTNPDKSALLQEQAGLTFKKENAALPTIHVDEHKTYQSMDGFGYCLTGGSASLINKLPARAQDSLLKELFVDNGVSYLRISIGASDLSAEPFTYDDMPAGQTDPKLEHFSLAAEQTDLIPVLKKILALNPHIKILGSPWSSPVWMKDNGSFKGGSLQPAFYDAYAQYFVKYIQGMKAYGITIDAITPQNEPLNPKNTPSLYMTAEQQRDFIKNSLGPAFKAAHITTKIQLYDHNADHVDYPRTVLSDPAAAAYVDGSAFHLYGGSIKALSELHNAFPNKHLYFTEQWVGGPGNFAKDLQWAVTQLIIGAPRNWCKNVLEWNLAADANYGPHTQGGCTSCQGAYTIGDSFSRNTSFYIIAHASRFVRPGSVRIDSDIPTGLDNVAFKTPDGKKVLIVVNNTTATQLFNIQSNGKTVTPSLHAGAVATFIW